ncbi:DUF6942 family protein [Microbulbifer sediminum]|uniref:DUF6942 family protein n=1 Tax=Microbulbifer sediminum TaxID=2904250 RepID=UPI001F38905B|nr:hypothetical protein [Microbulbifer sediminum]
MTSIDLVGSPEPGLALYLPNRPHGLAQLVESPSSQRLIDANSNHWRKIVTLLAKVVSPDAADWRRFRDEELFRHAALCFTPKLCDAACWHWIGGKDNLQRFGALGNTALPLPECPAVSIDPDRRLLLTPYPDYRQLSNEVVSHIRAALGRYRFYQF